MTKVVLTTDILFEIRDVFGNAVRTTRGYWQKIKQEKHTELTVGSEGVIATLQHPDEVYKSIQDDYISLYNKKIGTKDLVVLVKFVDDAGFVVTCYQTSKIKRKGEKLWP
jgi:hypothetical protein